MWQICFSKTSFNKLATKHTDISQLERSWWCHICGSFREFTEIETVVGEATWARWALAQWAWHEWFAIVLCRYVEKRLRRMRLFFKKLSYRGRGFMAFHPRHESINRFAQNKINKWSRLKIDPSSDFHFWLWGGRSKIDPPTLLPLPVCPVAAEPLAFVWGVVLH